MTSVLNTVQSISGEERLLTCHLASIYVAHGFSYLAALVLTLIGVKRSVIPQTFLLVSNLLLDKQSAQWIYLLALAFVLL